ncbi:MAG: HPr family phosphocarrier protein [Alphaproteobacteria bacterium]|nr:HPr family phosphocarrier protein [Alphaproteobacteria bacterium]
MTDPLYARTVTIINPLGLHARASGKLAKLTDQFNASVTVEKDQEVASSDSVMELMMLTAGPGDELTIRAAGPDAKAALDAVVGLIESGFGEEVGRS